MSHIRGQSRTQTTLFPAALEDLIVADAQVRVIDVFVESLDVVSLGFDKAIAVATGRPGYAPGFHTGMTEIACACNFEIGSSQARSDNGSGPA